MQARMLWALLRELSWREWRLHPWRHGVGVLAVALGVALAFSVHLINESALSEFSSAVRSATGQTDGALRCPNLCEDTVWDALATQEAVLSASPILEIDTYAIDRQGRRVAIKLLGLDALSIAAIAPELLPNPTSADESGQRLAALAADRVFLNPAALKALAMDSEGLVQLQAGLELRELRLGGTTAAGGSPLAVMDIAAAQENFAAPGQLSRVELRLAPGESITALHQAWRAQDWWPAGARIQAPDEGSQRVSAASRAYRVNLTVLALVALFVGAFLVFSVQALSVSQRTPTLALLGVLGLSPRQRLALVVSESLAMGILGSLLGLVLGTTAAWLALRWLSGDLGGGYFPGIAPSLQFSPSAALAFGALGVAAALFGGWAPARQAQSLAAAQALKGLGGAGSAGLPAWIGPALVAAGAALAFAPAVRGLPVWAYASVALLLLGGIACVPPLVGALLGAARPDDHALAVLAVGRARYERQAATVAVAGVVASLSLAVALTVMVASFRSGVDSWLQQVLPADLYARTATTSAASDAAYLPAEFIDAASRLDGVARIDGARLRPVTLEAGRPTVTLVARALTRPGQSGADPAQQLPMVGQALPASQARKAGLAGAYVTEAMEMLYGAKPGSVLELPLAGLAAPPLGRQDDGKPSSASGQPTVVRLMVLGVWRDYARQFGAVAMDLGQYQALTGDTRINDLAIWLEPGADAATVQQALQALAPNPGLVEFAAPAEIRSVSMRIFDRSFAVTYYLQALAIGIGLFGIAASFSAQVLARRREFGLLTHLGLSRGQIVTIVAGEGAAWTAGGALAGVLLGLAVSAVLVHVVNPQSFHWTMELIVPWDRLAALGIAVVAAGSLTAALSARRAAGADAILAVREDW